MHLRQTLVSSIYETRKRFHLRRAQTFDEVDTDRAREKILALGEPAKQSPYPVYPASAVETTPPPLCWRGNSAHSL